jgi:hypothetical protein
MRELLAAAQRIMPAKRPEEALNAPIELLAHAMRDASPEDMALLVDYVGEAGLLEAIERAPKGILDEEVRSQWSAKLGRPGPSPRAAVGEIC